MHRLWYHFIGEVNKKGEKIFPSKVFNYLLSWQLNWNVFCCDPLFWNSILVCFLVHEYDSMSLIFRIFDFILPKLKLSISPWIADPATTPLHKLTVTESAQEVFLWYAGVAGWVGVKSRFDNFWDPTRPPSWSKLPVCAKSGVVFWSSQFLWYAGVAGWVS